MTTHTERFMTNYGDTLEVSYDGTMFAAPSCGAQYATRDEAMRVELIHYLRASGEQIAEGEEVDLDAHGEWLDD